MDVEGEDYIIEAFGERKAIKEWLFDSRCVVDAKTLIARIREGRRAETALRRPEPSAPLAPVEAYGAKRFTSG